ncbi:MAG: metallophosphoesterase [Deltaproteobacteria bacterium]|nr:metallophosphoesterase [Deltaproteobacteria bacterium]
MPQSRTTVASFAAAMLLAAGPVDGQVLTRGPYLQNVTQSSVVVRFDLDAAAPMEVHFGPTDGYGSIADAGTASSFEVLLDGFFPGDEVHYALVSGGTTLAGDFSFTTSPPPRAPLRLLVLGDTRSNHADHAEVISAAVDENPHVCVHTGDLVSSGEVADDWVHFFDAEAALLAEVPQFAVIGNHEEDGGHVNLFTEYLTLPRNSPAPEHYYSVNYGNVHIVVLDGHVNVDADWVCILRIAWWESCFTVAQVDWLTADLAAARANPDIDHIFVFNHQGPYSSKSGRTGMKQMRDLMPLFADSGVSFVISGHDHYYERGYSGNGIPYIITAGGGAPLYDIGAPSAAPHTVVHNESTLHYTLFDIDHLIVTLVAYRIDGTVLDTYTFISEPRACTDPATDCGTLPPDCAAGEWVCEGGLCQMASCDAVPEPDDAPEPVPEASGEDSPEPAPDEGAVDGFVDTGPDPDAESDAPGVDPAEPSSCGCRMVT